MLGNILGVVLFVAYVAGLTAAGIGAGMLLAFLAVALFHAGPMACGVLTLAGLCLTYSANCVVSNFRDESNDTD